MESLWGEEFTIKETPKQTKKILQNGRKYFQMIQLTRA